MRRDLSPQPSVNTAPPRQGHLVIIGNGMAAHRLLEALTKAPTGPAWVTVIGEEASAAYNRIMLSAWLAGDIDHDELALPSIAAHRQAKPSGHGHDEGAPGTGQGTGQGQGDAPGPHLSHRRGLRVEAIDRQRRLVHCADGEVFAYDHLVIATGSRSAMPEVPGIDLEGVGGFRDLADAEDLAAGAEHGGQAVVIGGGLLGLEAAEGLRRRGMEVTVLQRGPRLMNRQLDAAAADLLAAELKARGVSIRTDAQLAEIFGDDRGRVSGVRLIGDDARLPAQRVVIAAGITPNAELGRQAGLDCDRAIRVDERLTTSDAAISALGECCQFKDTTYGLVEPIWRQVAVLSAHLTGQDHAPYRDQDSATKLKVSGVSLYAFGPTEADGEHEVLTYHDREQGEYRRLLLKEGRLEGVVLYGDTRMGPWLFQLANDATRLDTVRQSLLLGQSDTESLMAERPFSTDNDATTQEAAA
ncbi:NAD(P)/FAD-dependent oxidoreductase [Halomonas sp. V046]|uniref:NAD(P)/FAD-dependent oxidoreductase n=1 Tax=Halomonas sp. V046 TaxID=3459611 RepID=UPI004044D7A4